MPNNDKGKQSRIGGKFYKEVEAIKDKRLRNGKDKDRISTKIITNLIVRHDLWSDVSKKIIEADEEEVKEYGQGGYNEE